MSDRLVPVLWMDVTPIVKVLVSDRVVQRGHSLQPTRHGSTSELAKAFKHHG